MDGVNVDVKETSTSLKTDLSVPDNIEQENVVPDILIQNKPVQVVPDNKDVPAWLSKVDLSHLKSEQAQLVEICY